MIHTTLEILVLLTGELVSQHVEENGEVDLSWGFGDHAFKGLGIHTINAEGFESGLKISNIDDTVSVSIDHTEGFLEFFSKVRNCLHFT